MKAVRKLAVALGKVGKSSIYLICLINFNTVFLVNYTL